MAADDVDASRSEVKTYVPAYQKDIWREHADRLDMSQSEFVRTMVQAGRRGFDLGDDGDAPSDPGGDGDELADRVEALLDEHGPMDWDELLEKLTADVETRLDEAMETLQADNRVRYSGRDGGYTVVDEP